MLQQNDAYSTQVQLQQNVTSSSENHQQQLQYVPNSILHMLIRVLSKVTYTCRTDDYEEEADPSILLQQNDAYSSQAQLQYI